MKEWGRGKPIFNQSLNSSVLSISGCILEDYSGADVSKEPTPRRLFVVFSKTRKYGVYRYFLQCTLFANDYFCVCAGGVGGCGGGGV